jgi:hypothetical protein
MRLFENICLGTVTAAAAVLLAEGALFVRQARIDADKITGQVMGLALPTKNAEAQLASAAKTFAQVGEHERDAFEQQQDYFSNLSLHTNLLLNEATITLQTFNATVLPRVASSLDASRDLQMSAMRNLTDTSAKIDGTIEELQPLIDNGIRATSAAAAAMSDPAIHETLDHLDASAGNLEGMSADGKKMTADVAAFTHRELAPVRGTWHVIKSFLMEFAGPAAQVATAAK